MIGDWIERNPYKTILLLAVAYLLCNVFVGEVR